MKLSVVIPVYNEINTIEEILRRVQRVPIDKEIIIVDDGSTDGTREILKQIKTDNIRIIFHDRNQGKGAALQTGFSQVTGDIVIVQDADLEYYPDEYPQVIELIEQGKADVVYGSRFLGRHRVFLFSHYLGNQLLNFLTNFLYNTNLTDMETCYKAFRREVIHGAKFRSKSFGFEPEFTAYVFRKKYRVYEVPISYDGRGYDEGKKITWKDGLIALYWLLRGRFGKVEREQDSLFQLATLTKYTQWIYTTFSRELGNRIFETGAGIGNFTRLMLGKELLVTSNASPTSIIELRRRIIENDRVKIVQYNLVDAPQVELKQYRFDTVLCLNVLEHIENDTQALNHIAELLEPDGRLILLLPAIPQLYGKLDQSLNHQRRYTKPELIDKLAEAGFATIQIRYINLFGAIAWWFNSVLLRRKKLPAVQLRVFNALVPFLRWFETKATVPFGMSLIAIAKKKVN
ncbi:MAG: glycosyltransferase [bacterium]|nr:glycosyltransferase [bacterium]